MAGFKSFVDPTAVTFPSSMSCIVGPNGCGKSTLIKLLLGELEPDSGSLKTGTRLQVAYFDQAREKLDQQQRVHDYIAEGRDFLEIGGKDLHVISYLQNFLFNPYSIGCDGSQVILVYIVLAFYIFVGLDDSRC